MSYDIGDRIRVTASFTIAGTPSNGTVTGRVKDPSGVITTLTLTNSPTGSYYADVDLDEAGNWYFEFASTATVVAAVRGQVDVRPNAFS